MQHTQIGFIGGGNMASSLIGGLAKRSSQAATINADQLWVYDRDTDKLASLQSQFGVHIASSNQQLIEQCDVVVLAVKPQIMKGVLTPLAKAVKSKNTPPLFISIAAGIPMNAMQRWLGTDIALVRVMPNTPSLIGVGATGLYANSYATEAQRVLSEQLFASVGITQWVATEAEIDDVIALSGSGPAYVMLFIQSLIDAAVKAGMDASTAKQLALQTASGATELIRQSDLPIATLINNVTSPGGTTEQALLSFRRAGLENLVADAYAAAKRRAAEMSTELDV